MTRRPNVVNLIVRAVWLVQPLAFVPLLSAATQDLPDAGRVLVALFAWAGWATVLLAALVPSTVSLTLGRLIAPSVVVIAVACSAADVAGWKLAIGIGASSLSVLVWFSGEVGAAFAQGSAYGSEQRFPLKPPVAMLIPMITSWMVLSGAAAAGLVLAANGMWLAGGALLGGAGVIAAFVGPRFHQLTRRWLVIVPAGVVVHDPMLLTENALFLSAKIEAIHLALSDTEAADLTGGTAGVAIEIVLREMDTVTKIGSRADPATTALHVLSVLVSPTRPGMALRAAAERKLPVG